jgi:hypothetical protein
MNKLSNVTIENSGVMLPVDPKDLGQFISSLLGQPQTFERLILRPFAVDHAWLVHLLSATLQRIQQQNAPEPLTFEATIQYQNGYRRKLSSFAAFQHFAETQNLVSTAVKFEIAILIQFPDKKVPERQTIFVSFDSRYEDLSLVDLYFKKDIELGQIRVEIRHTERTWADDVFNLIEREVGQIAPPEAGFKSFIKDIGLPSIPYAIVLSLLAVMVYLIGKIARGQPLLAAKAKELLNRPDQTLEGLHGKLDLILKDRLTLLEGALFERLDLVVIGGSVLVVVVIALATGFARSAPSFVTLTPAALLYREKLLSRLKRKNAFVLISMIISVVLGILGNYIYDQIK